MLWVDKYRPKKLSDLTFNPILTKRLKKMQRNNIPHTIFGGPEGSGKRTCILSFLNEIYGDGVHKKKIQHRQYKLPSKNRAQQRKQSSCYEQ